MCYNYEVLITFILLLSFKFKYNKHSSDVLDFVTKNIEIASLPIQKKKRFIENTIEPVLFQMFLIKLMRKKKPR